MRTPAALTALLTLAACTPDGDTADTGTPSVEERCGGDELPVTIPTHDGEELAGDWWPGPDAEGGVIILFHDQGRDRSDHPQRVRAALRNAGVAVLNLDRRVHGESTGTAEAALNGTGALADAEAAVDFLLSSERPCPVSEDSLVLLGAGAGTAPTFDYLRLRGPEQPQPAAMVWLSPAEVTTTNQDDLAQIVVDDRASVSLPMLWLYGESETYAQAFITADVPGAWIFVEQGTESGSAMFDGGDLEEQTLASILDFVEASQTQD